jgi:uncharacterized protein Yka (UPF0111/DUF47 family)
MLFGKLLPREGNFFELFNQHGTHIAEGSRAFVAMMQNYQRRCCAEARDEVDHAERQADKVTAEVNRLLHKTFITPIDREQIHGLINAMDDILDLLQDSTESDVALRREDHSETCCAGRDLGAKCCERVQHVVTLLPRWQGGGGRGGAQDLRGDRPPRIRCRPGDAIAMSKLFREQDDVRELIKLKAIYEHLESISDRCEDVANLIEGVVLENS